MEAEEQRSALTLPVELWNYILSFLPLRETKVTLVCKEWHTLFWHTKLGINDPPASLVYFFGRVPWHKLEALVSYFYAQSPIDTPEKFETVIYQAHSHGPLAIRTPPALKFQASLSSRTCFPAFDRDGDGVISIMEFFDGLKQVMTGKKKEREDIVTWMIDRDRDGVITGEDLTFCVKRAMEHLARADPEQFKMEDLEPLIPTMTLGFVIKHTRSGLPSPENTMKEPLRPISEWNIRELDENLNELVLYGGAVAICIRLLSKWDKGDVLYYKKDGSKRKVSGIEFRLEFGWYYTLEGYLPAAFEEELQDTPPTKILSTFDNVLNSLAHIKMNTNKCVIS